MKNIQIIFKLLLFPFLFISILSFSNADDNSINGTCPGEFIEEITGTTINASHTENGTIGGGGNDRYRMTFPVAGTLDISAINRDSSRNGNYYFYVSRNNCGNTDADWNIISAVYGTSHSTSVAVNAGDTIYIRLQSISTEPQQRYSLTLDFTAVVTPSIDICPGVVIPNLDGTSVTATDSFNNITVPANTTYYYHFTPTEAGTIQTNSSANRSYNSLYIKDGCGANLWSNTTNSTNKSSPQIAVAANQQIVIAFERRYTTSLTLNFIDFTYTVTVPLPPTMGNIPDQTLEVGTPFTLSIATYVTEPNNDTITYSLSGSLPAGLSFDPFSGIISGTPTALGNFNLSATATDKDGTSNADAFTITVTMPPAPEANNDSYSTPVNTAISENVLSNDTGYNITVTSNTSPSNGILSISADGSLVYTPNLSFSGTDTFEYTITDAYDRNDTATVTIVVADETDFQSGVQDFVLINPIHTRNMVGNYAILGNTVECITTTRGDSGSSIDPDHFDNATCTNDRAYNDNNYIAKYIDIDGTSGIGAPTWNSSSSNFTLPDTYNEQDSGRGIAWAGLFWQGAINNDLSYDQRRAYPSGTTFDYKYITSDQDIDLETTDGNKVLIRVDNDATYTPLQAHTFYYDRAFGDRGGYYAAYTDITALLQSKDLAKGDHTITVANITANEGRQSGTGDYAGWSMVVIYKEEAVPEAKARNISIYNGYTTVYNGQARTARISGFKLPESGEVNAQFAAFAGEGEYIYGDGAEYDRMVISRNSDLSNASTMPGAIDPNNIFDAILANIDRDSGNNNEMTGNNNGIDVENYDVSSIMTAYRDADENINTVYIGLSSSQDYITPSMLSFSAELYKPNVCYDYVVKRDEYTIPSDDRLINAYINVNDELSITVAVRSLESDFDLTGSKLAVTMFDTDGSASFVDGEYSPTTSNILLPTDVTATSTAIRPEIAIGKDRNVDTGGTIGNFERYFAKYNYNINSVVGGKFSTEFNIELNTTVDFGSGPVSQLLPLPRCEQTAVYSPVWGQFNVERNFVSVPPVSDPTARYSLYTQIAGKDFDYSVAHYDDSDPVNPQAISNATVDVELIDATAFDDNTSFLKCSNTDPSIIIGGLHNSTFVQFGVSPLDRVSITSSSDLVDVPALKSAVFRMWTLLDENGTLISHTNAKEDGHQFKIIYDEHYRDRVDLATPKLCGTACGANGVAGDPSCYQCLRTYFATPNCSRDNFAIRPESYRIALSDIGANGENSTTPLEITKNDSTMSTKSLAAEYQYKMAGVSTKYGSTDVAERYYNENFLIATPDMIISPNEYNDIIALEFNGPTACQDTNHSIVNLSFSNGYIDDYNLSHNNAGDYNLWIEDNQWTKVDQADQNPYKTIFDPACRAASLIDTVPSYCNDCLIGENSSTTDPKVGCTTDSNIEDNGEYNEVALAFEPYQFDLNQTRFITHPNDNGTHLYMGDLTKSMGMAAKIEGNMTAEGKNGTVLSNFTDGCAAEDVRLWLNRTMIPQEGTILSENANPVSFQQVIRDIYGIDTFSTDGNLTLGKENFVNTGDNNGSAEVDLYFNFAKPYAELVNPIDVNFTVLNADSSNASSNANMVSNYIPDGNRTINQDRYFYFAKVSPSEGIDGIETFEILVQTILKVNTFCRDDVNITCSDLPGFSPFGIGAVPEEVFPGGGWYRMTNHLSSLGDGQVNTLSTTVPGVGISPSSNITFDSNGSTGLIDITYPLTNRPVHPVIVIDPDEWLKYNPDVSKNGLQEFTIHFLNQGLKWKGEGKTGNVVETEPSTGSNQRINW